MTEKLNLTQTELVNVKATFGQKYQYANPSTSFAWDIKVNWLELANAIESNIQWEPNETLLRFIHRYDENGWFLTMECCHVDESGNIDNFGSRFDLRNNQIEISDGFNAHLDQNYFDNVLYENSPLQIGTHVNSLVFPWSQEIKEAAIVNEVSLSPEANIIFTSVSFDFGLNPTKVNIRWPHTIAFYFAIPQGNLLDNQSYDGTIVKYKAFNYADPCPSNCSNTYSWPIFFNDTKPYQ